MSTLSSSPDLAARVRPTAVSRAGVLSMVLAVTCLGVWAGSLSRSLFDPIWIDQAFFRYLAQRVIAGQRVYTDLYTANGPAIVGIHWLSIKLFGPSEMSLRIFDAVWQLGTVGALIALCARDGRRWHAAWLAAILYGLAYYGFGHTDTAEREGFAVLPLLLMAHTVSLHQTRARWLLVSRVIAGMLGLVLFAIKPPLGLCFGVLWLHALAEAWTRRHEGLRAYVALVGLTAGFMVALAGMIGGLVWLGWWEGYWPILSGAEFENRSILGPWMMLEMMPRMAAAGLLIAVGLGLTTLARHHTDDTEASSNRGLQALLSWLRLWLIGLVVFGLLLTLVYWPSWRAVFLRVMGLGVPAIGVLIMTRWESRSRVWRIIAWLTVAVFGAILIQGNFNTYQFHPLLALASYLVAVELFDRLRPHVADREAARVWLAIFLAGFAHLAICHWWRKMTVVTTQPYVLADATLEGHYTSVTAGNSHALAYPTLRNVTVRVQVLTAADDPIACLFCDTRLYYLANRPPVHRLCYIHPDVDHLFAGLMGAIENRRPKVVLARVPEPYRDHADSAVVETAVFADLEATFGPTAASLRDHYHVAERIGDVCILQPTTGRKD